MATRKQVKAAGAGAAGPKSVPKAKSKTTKSKVAPAKAATPKTATKRAPSRMPSIPSRGVTIQVSRAELSDRIREIRREVFGENGGPELARRLGVPVRYWYNYETGVAVPGDVLLSLVDETGADLYWLFTGRGPRFRQGARPD